MLSVVPDRSFLYQSCPDHARQPCIAPPVQVVTRLNRHFVNSSGVLQFFTNRETAEFRYVSAGHLSPILVRGGVASRMGEAGGIPAGLLPGATYEENSVTLFLGDRLYLCTDGIFEAANPAEQEFGVDRLLETLTRHRALPLDESLSSLLQCVEQWSAPAGPPDDASMLAIERSG
jgi:sigma-B regulation protein RsbU (phosphoserine phosphatase)